MIVVSPTSIEGVRAIDKIPICDLAAGYLRDVKAE